MTSTYDETILINLNSINAIQNNGSYLSDVYFNFKNIIRDVDDILEIKNIIDEFKHSILKNYSFSDKKIISDLLKIGKQSKLKNKQKNIFGFITDYKDMDKIIESNIDCIVLPIELNINNKKNQSKH